MGRFEYNERGGRCYATDTTGGVRLDWLRGDFAATVDTEILPFGTVDRLDEQGAPETAEVLAEIRRNLEYFVAEEHPDAL